MISCSSPQTPGERRRRKSKRYRVRKLAKDPWYYILDKAKMRAKKKKIPFNLNVDWIRKRWTGRCEVTGIAFKLKEAGEAVGPRPFGPSIDRIRPELGYVKDNCRIVLFALNALKGSGSDDDVLLIAKEIVRAFEKSPGQNETLH